MKSFLVSIALLTTVVIYGYKIDYRVHPMVRDELVAKVSFYIGERKIELKKNSYLIISAKSSSTFVTSLGKSSRVKIAIPRGDSVQMFLVTDNYFIRSNKMPSQFLEGEVNIKFGVIDQYLIEREKVIDKPEEYVSTDKEHYYDVLSSKSIYNSFNAAHRSDTTLLYYCYVLPKSTGISSFIMNYYLE